MLSCVVRGIRMYIARDRSCRPYVRRDEKLARHVRTAVVRNLYRRYCMHMYVWVITPRSSGRAAVELRQERGP